MSGLWTMGWGWVSLAAAAQTVEGTAIRVSTNDAGVWNDPDTSTGFQWSPDGGSEWVEFTYAGYAWQRFAISYTAGEDDLVWFNNSHQYGTNLEVLAEATVDDGVSIGTSYTYGGGGLTVVKDELWGPSDSVMLVRFTLFNGGDADLEDLVVLYAADADQDSARTYNTLNNVQRLDSAPAGNWVESIGPESGYAIGFGACDPEDSELGHDSSWSTNTATDNGVQDGGGNAGDAEMVIRYLHPDPLPVGGTLLVSFLVSVAETDEVAQDLYLAARDTCAFCDDDFDGVDGDACGGADCDDADAGAFPGAPESWYDGVDQDCAGDNDFDADADGDTPLEFGGSDCDDADPTRSGLSTETWYDGVDQDCAGDDDFDADGDGAVAQAFEGTDCNDADAGVSPDAAEIWYDGVDQDCDGNDTDADGDGVGVDEDCDDTDAARADAADCPEGDDGGADTAAGDGSGRAGGSGGKLGVGCAVASGAPVPLLGLGVAVALLGARRRRRG